MTPTRLAGHRQKREGLAAALALRLDQAPRAAVGVIDGSVGLRWRQAVELVQLRRLTRLELGDGPFAGASMYWLARITGMIVAVGGIARWRGQREADNQQ